ncbi:MAG TPA: ABC transporter substrate-binding protein [Streptosporangiaceae bacterium]|nr:ABC transporter substrate-binding protein [Streptosporangiaceae bacterium]
MVTAAALALSACSSTSSPAATPSGAAKGGTATVGFVAGQAPNWIWPFIPIAYESVPNGQDFEYILYRPLYMFGNNGNSVQVDYPLSPANAPVYSDGGKTVTIQLKGWKWSDGEAVDAQDVAFWLNMMKAEKSNYAGYTPGTLPDNLASFSITGPDTIVLHLTKNYASTWFTYNQLAEITPMPLAWDVTHAGAKPGSGGCHTSTAGCAAVFSFLTAQAKDATSYATSPIWSVVDGPWKLAAFTVAGADTFVPNKAYSGSPKPALSAVKYVTYTSDTAEYTALKTGSLDVGQVPSADLPQKPLNQAVPAANPLGSGYKLQPFDTYAIAYYQINFNNPTYGPVFKQLYFRQALMYVNDQEGMSKAIYRGYAYPTTGPVPPEPANAFEPAVEMANGGAGAYPFDIAKAKSLLESHGWKLVGGVMTCETPALCGSGIKAGTQARFTMDYTSGVAALQAQEDVYKSDAAQAGISIATQAESFSTLLGVAVSTNKSWVMVDISGWAYDGPGYLPTGEPLFLTGAPSNSGGYSNPTMDSMIREIQDNSSMSLFHQYATFTAEQLPFIWVPQQYFIQAVKSNLQGVTWNPMYTFLPEYWYFTK